MPEHTKLAARSPGHPRGGDLVAALSMTLPGTFDSVTQTVLDGGPLQVTVSNNGLGTAFAGFVSAEVIVFPLRTGGVYVWDSRPAANNFTIFFWRRASRGELLAPDTVVRSVLSGPSQYPESLIETSAVGTPPQSVARVYTALPPLPLATSVNADVATPAIPAGSGFQSGVWSWCLVLRSFDVMQDPRSTITLPTPLQPPHHVKLACLHDGSA